MEMEPARRAAHRPAQLAYDYSLFAPADATAPKVCRDFVRTVLLTLDREPLITPATLCTSELVTNVHLHTKGTAMLRVQLTPARLRVSVYDESREPPVTPAATGTACWGRGLALVAEVADLWGVAGERAGRFAKGCGSSWGGRSPATRTGGWPVLGTCQAVM